MPDRRTLPSPAHAVAALGVAAGLPNPELRGTARLAAHLGAQPYGLPIAAIHLLDDTRPTGSPPPPGRPSSRRRQRSHTTHLTDVLGGHRGVPSSLGCLPRS
jgi:hypothetical protein